MQRKLHMLVFACLLMALSGCAGSQVECPLLSENVTWSAFGHFAFGGAGDDSTAREIVSSCGWHIFDGHNGGVGDTLEVSAPNEGVVLVWSFNNLSAFRTTSGWAGKTDRGIKIGDSASLFLSLYPEFTVVNQGLFTFANGDTYVEAHFDSNGDLEELVVGQHFRT